MTVDQYIVQQLEPQQAICLKVRNLILETLPGIKEEMKWGVPAYGNGRFYFVALKDHVNVGFALRGLSKEEIELFEGKGKTMRHIKVQTPDDMDVEKITRLLKLVAEKTLLTKAQG